MASTAKAPTRTTLAAPGGPTFVVQSLDVGRAVHVWVGVAGAAPAMGSLTAAAPTRPGTAADGPASATCLLGESAAGEDAAGRLSAHAGKLVLLSYAPSVDEALAADDAPGGGGGIGGGAGVPLQPWLERQLRGLLRPAA